MPTSPLQSIPLPDSSNAPNVPYDLGAAVGEVEKKLVMSYASAAARAAALPSPVEGMVAWLEDVDRLTEYTGSAWRYVRPGFDEVKTTVTSSSAAIGSTETTLATLPSFTADGATDVELALSYYNFVASAAPISFFLRFYDGATLLDERLLVMTGASVQLNTGQGTARTIFTPAAGAHAAVTAKLVRNGGTSETAQLVASSTRKAIFTGRAVL